MNRMENNECLRCGTPLVRIDDDSMFRFVCSKCEEELKQAYHDQKNKNARPFKHVKKLRLNVLGRKNVNLGTAKKMLENT